MSASPQHWDYKDMSLHPAFSDVCSKDQIQYISCLGSIRTYPPSPKVVFFLTCCVVMSSELKHPFPKERKTCETQLEDQEGLSPKL